MSLRKYKSKRNFKVTSEPEGKKTKSRGELSFVIQKHAASRLHYDFRLEWDGVLKSWAVPKGPSLDPNEKRLAVQVEDHPIEYGSFEGIIPKGEYGGGTVMLWDRGTWKPHGSVSSALKSGALSFELQGERLHGRWSLVRLPDRKNWLLIKGKDQYSQRKVDHDVVLENTRSVVSEREMEEIAGAGEIWSSNRKKKNSKSSININKSIKKTMKTTVKTRDRTTEKTTENSTHPVIARLTNPEKILYKDLGIKKSDVAHYYSLAADQMLRHLANRPIMILRCAQGTQGSCFFQKNWHKGMPKSLHRVRDGIEKELLVVKDRDGLVDLAQIAALEIHSWGAKADDLEHPDQLVFDLDPDEAVAWEDVVDVAFLLKKNLQALGLQSFVKSTGGKGIHIVVPIVPKFPWKEAKALSRAICAELVTQRPHLLLLSMNKARRKGKIFLDYLRNGRGATAIVPFSLRARPGAPIAVPISWADLKRAQKPDLVHFSDIELLARILKNHPWKGFESLKQSPQIPRRSRSRGISDARPSA
jgi:bifunctional non-homologous end joining protein LigD